MIKSKEGLQWVVETSSELKISPQAIDQWPNSPEIINSFNASVRCNRMTFDITYLGSMLLEVPVKISDERKSKKHNKLFY